MVQILERVDAHYESREVPFGKVYEWHPAAVALECECGEKVTLSTTSTRPPVVGAAPTSTPSATPSESVKAVCRTISHIPGSMMPESAPNNTSMMRLLILKARPGATTILRRPPTRSKPKEKKDSHASRTNRQRDGAGGSPEAGEGPRPAKWKPFVEALEAVVETPAGRQLEELRCGVHQDEEMRYWQANLLSERVSEQAVDPVHIS